MALLASGSSHSFGSTSLDAVENSSSASTSTERFLHITGEVTNPVLLENFIIEHPMVQSAFLFGHGRYNAGVLIDLEDSCKIDTSDAEKVEEMRNKLQPVIERTNMFAPQHARMQKEMILFTTPTKPFIYTSRNSARANRRDTLTVYNNEINTLYNTMADAANIPLKPPKIWSRKKSLTYVRGIIVAVLGKKPDDRTDLVCYGIDSLQATRIRVILFHALQSTAKANTRKFSGDIVYQFPTIAGLARFATRAAIACFRHRTKSALARLNEMTKMIQSHSRDFPKHQASMLQPQHDVVLITGTTGLAEFLQNTRVARVYALNRRKSRPGSGMERQAELLQASGLSPALAHHPELTFIEADATRNQLAAPEGPVSACDAAGRAYGESKWIGEQILAAAASETPLRPTIIRVGPLCGAANGRWRDEAHLPMIVHLGVTLGALPKIDEVVHWIPAHTAARAVAELRNSSSPYLHVTHPLPVSSLVLLRHISDQFHLPLVPIAQWTVKLETHVYASPLPASPSKLEDPALTILRHLQDARDPTADAVPTRIFNHARIASDEAWFASPTLHGGVTPLGIEHVRCWLRQWHEVGLVP